MINLFAKKAVAGIEGAAWREPGVAFDEALKEAGEADVILLACHRLDEAAVRKIAERRDVLKILVDADGTSRLKATGLPTPTVIVKPPDRGTEVVVGELQMKHGAATWYSIDRYYRTTPKAGKDLAGEGAGSGRQPPGRFPKPATRSSSSIPT